MLFILWLCFLLFNMLRKSVDPTENMDDCKMTVASFTKLLEGYEMFCVEWDQIAEKCHQKNWGNFATKFLIVPTDNAPRNLAAWTVFSIGRRIEKRQKEIVEYLYPL